MSQGQCQQRSRRARVRSGAVAEGVYVQQGYVHARATGVCTRTFPRDRASEKDRRAGVAGTPEAEKTRAKDLYWVRTG